MKNPFFACRHCVSARSVKSVRQRLLWVLVLTVAVSGCGGERLGFLVQDGKAVFVAKVSGAPGSRTITRPVAADPKSFKAVETLTADSIPYGKGFSKVYLGYSTRPFLLSGCNAATFEILTPDGHYTQDNRHVYFWGLKLEGSDSKTFRLLDRPYSVDAHQAYAGARVISGADAANFEVVMAGETGLPLITSGSEIISRDDTSNPTGISGWARDGTHYYQGSVRVDDADYDSFVILNSFYAKDAEHVYYAGRKGPFRSGEEIVFVVHGADPDSFVLTSSISGRDKLGEYVRGRRKKPDAIP